MEELAGLFDVPDGRGWQTDWLQVERRLGTALPDDYKELVGHFGLGEFDDYMGLLIPGASNSLLDISEVSESLNRSLNEDPSLRESFAPFEIFPILGGLLRWSSCGNGQKFYWRTGQGDPNAWSVVAWEFRGPEWREYEMETSQFLYKMFVEGIADEIVPERDEDQPFVFSPL
ncbi:SMI1/KNR4 family protein [Embleya sp. NPDC059259]|uniref:SMI1/KNR4 family protein n=1 Tax=unclassified Embleya TaxID=2699296 RepID=UPI003691ADE8